MEKGLRALNEREKKAEWAARITACRNSGQSVVSWCKENGVCSQTYYKWQKRLFEAAKTQQEAQFVDVTPVHNLDHSGAVAVTVRLASGVADIHAGADAATIETVLRILKSC